MLQTIRRTKTKWLHIGLFSSFLACFAVLFSGASNPSTHSFAKKALVLKVNGSINPGSADYIQAGITKAEKEQYALVILELDTPGGLLSSTRSIVKQILNADVPVVVFVTPSGARAGSAGVFITMAGHVAAMSPGTNIGAAHPVLGGKDPEKAGGKHLAKKIENDTVAFIQAIAKQRKKNEKWAKKAVLQSASITSTKAKELNVIDLIARDKRELMKKLSGFPILFKKKKIILKTEELAFVEFQMTFKQNIINLFSNPNIAYFLMMFGMLGILAEIYHPGSIFPGVVGAICLLLAFVASQVLPINYGGVALLLLGVLLMVAEAFTPTFGLLFVGGLVSLTLGSIFLIDSPDPSMQVSLTTVLPTIATIGVLAGSALFVSVRAQANPLANSQEKFLGDTAEVSRALEPKGMVRYRGELWSALSESGEAIDTGSLVEIVQRDGLVLTVKQKS